MGLVSWNHGKTANRDMSSLRIGWRDGAILAYDDSEALFRTKRSHFFAREGVQSIGVQIDVERDEQIGRAHV